MRRITPGRLLSAFRKNREKPAHRDRRAELCPEHLITGFLEDRLRRIRSDSFRLRGGCEITAEACALPCPRPDALLEHLAGDIELVFGNFSRILQGSELLPACCGKERELRADS